MGWLCGGDRYIPDFYLSIFYFIYSGASEGHSTGDVVAVIILSFIIVEGVMRVIRWAVVYKAPVFLYFLHFPAFIGIFIGAMMLQHHSMGNIIGSIVIFAIVGIYFLIIIIFRKKGIMKRSLPGVRFAVLRAHMSIGERVTLVFPDRYIKFLETGDEKYLKVRGND